MEISKITGVRIDGIYACVPQIEIDSEEALKELFGEEAKGIVKTTGIRKRYYAEPGTSSLDLCCDCARKLMEDSGVKKEEIGGVVFVTFTPENIMPANAMAIQSRLGLNSNIPAFDVGLACSGYGYGLWLSAMMAKNMNKKILFLDGDVQSAYLSGLDKSTVPVLSDAGSATIVSPDENAQDWFFSFYSNGENRDVLMIPAGGSGHPVTEADLKQIEYEDGSKRRNADIYMDGFAVYKFVAQETASFIEEFMEQTGYTNETLDAFVPHQANMFMIKQLAKKLKINLEKMWKSGEEYGNSASATVPVTIAKNAKECLVPEDSRVLFSGFGGGLSISVGAICLNKNANYKIYQYGKDE